MILKEKLVSALVILAAAALALQFAGCGSSAAKTQAETEKALMPSSSSLMDNTRWITDDNSEVVFTEGKIDWYRSSQDHTDNYYSGTFQFYIGRDAVQYITGSLSEYGITEQDLQALFRRSSEYDQSSFVVFDIRYDRFVLDGEDQTITRPLVPWYGFLLKDGTYLDVANMNTGTYYPFTKQSE